MTKQITRIEFIKKFNSHSSDSKAILLKEAEMGLVEIETFKNLDVSDIAQNANDGHEIIANLWNILNEMENTPTFQTVQELDKFCKHQANKANAILNGGWKN